MINVKNGYWYDSELDLPKEESVAELLKETEASIKIERGLGYKIMDAFANGKELSELMITFNIPKSSILKHLRNQGVEYLKTCSQRLFDSGRSINQIAELTGLAPEVVFTSLTPQTHKSLAVSALAMYNSGHHIPYIRINLDISRKICYQLLESVGVDIVSVLEGKLNEFFKTVKARSKSQQYP